MSRNGWVEKRARVALARPIDSVRNLTFTSMHYFFPSCFNIYIYTINNQHLLPLSPSDSDQRHESLTSLSKGNSLRRTQTMSSNGKESTLQALPDALAAMQQSTKARGASFFSLYSQKIITMRVKARGASFFSLYSHCYYFLLFSSSPSPYPRFPERNTQMKKIVGRPIDRAHYALWRCLSSAIAPSTTDDCC